MHRTAIPKLLNAALIKIKRLSAALLLVGYILAMPHAWAASLSAASLSIVPGPSDETIILYVPNVYKHKLFTLKNPDRLVIDVPKIDDTQHITLPNAYNGDLVKKVRTGLFTKDTTRIVFDLKDAINVSHVRATSNSLTIKISADEAAAIESRKTRSFASLFEGLEPPRISSSKPGKDIIDDTLVTKSPRPTALNPTVRRPEKNVPLQAKAPPSKIQSFKQTAQKARVEKPMIVIDPGHGGTDPGASGKRGSVEKDIVLDYARALEKKLLDTGRYRVKLTRRNDQYIMLRERVSIARKYAADIFVSLHADSAPGSARGLSIYTVSEEASDEEAQALAARENKSDVLSGLNLDNERKDVADILISLAERDTKNRSATLADLLVESLKGNVTLLPETHRFAGFAVLKAPDVPSVLIEIGFLSHIEEEKLIKSSSHRNKVVAKIARGIDTYFQKENALWNP